MELEEMIKNYKFTISTYLEYIGLCTDNLLSSQEAQANNKLFRNLTIILSSAFKTYLSTPNLETYLYEPTVNIFVPHYSDFKGYKTGAFIIVSFTNKLNRFNAFNKDNTKEKFYYPSPVFPQIFFKIFYLIISFFKNIIFLTSFW